MEKSLGPQVLLTDGSLIVGDVREIDREKLLLDSDLLGLATLRLDAVPAVLFHPPSDRHRRDQLVRRLLTAGGESDRVLLDNGDELSGTLAALHDDVATLETATGKIEFELGRIAAVIFNPTLRRPAGSSRLRVLVGLRDGSRLLAASLDTDAAKARLRSPMEPVWRPTAKRSWPCSRSAGKSFIFRTSNRPAISTSPSCSFPGRTKFDRNVAADLLRAGGKVRLKGLGMHSASRLTYNLDRQYRRLDAELAIDDAAAGYGSVVFRVFVDDGSGRWQPKFTSGIVRGGAAPVRMSVDLTGAKRISLLVEFADRGDERDDADWLDARLIK